MKKFKHIKTGKEYILVSDKFMFKDKDTEPTCIDGEYNERDVYFWRKGLILYKATYDCPDGPYFARTPEDFYANFEELKEHIPDYGDVMTFGEFLLDREYGMITSYDGTGRWVDDNDCFVDSDRSIFNLSKDENGNFINYPEGATKIIWFNR